MEVNKANGEDKLIVSLQTSYLNQWPKI